MKTGIHPTFYDDAIVICGTCGTTWHTGATKKEIHVDVCSNCHPFYTGTQRIVDTAGQVERFTKRLQAREAIAPQAEAKPNKKERRRVERARRSGMLEATQPEPAPAESPVVKAAETVGEAVGTAEAVITEAGKTVAEGLQSAAQAVSGVVESVTGGAPARPPRERRPRPPRPPRPPRERAPRPERSAEGGEAGAPRASQSEASAPAETPSDEANRAVTTAAEPSAVQATQSLGVTVPEAPRAEATDMQISTPEGARSEFVSPEGSSPEPAGTPEPADSAEQSGADEPAVP